MEDNPQSFLMLSRDIKVGAFVLAGIIVLSFVIFMIGQERRLFSSKEEFFTVFDDVQGLRRGSPVRMGGVDIGSVSEVSYGDDAKDTHIYVRVSIVAEEAPRIRKDSVASIDAKGLLGDKMVVISVGSPGTPSVPSGSKIPSTEGEDMAAMLGKLGALSTKVEHVVDNLERTTTSLADEDFHQDLRSGVKSLSQVLAALERQDGYLGKLVGDPEEAARVSRAVGELEQTTQALHQAAATVNRILGQVQDGPGLAHEVLYGSEGAQAAQQIGHAAEEVSLTLKGVREGDGLMHGVLFGGGESGELVTNLNQISGEAREIMAGLRAGRGTLGALLVDPSVYEDLKLLLGNVQRNKALRALVRYSIRQEDATPKVEDPDPERAARSRAPDTQGGATQLGGALGDGPSAADPSP